MQNVGKDTRPVKSTHVPMPRTAPRRYRSTADLAANDPQAYSEMLGGFSPSDWPYDDAAREQFEADHGHGEW